MDNIEFRVADMLNQGFPDASFDAVVCIFGIFFVPDMEAAATELWHMVRPGGRLAVTTWGPNLFEPANSAFWEAIDHVRPDLHRNFNPWDRISHPGGLYSMLAKAGIRNCDIVAEAGLRKEFGRVVIVVRCDIATSISPRTMNKISPMRAG